jgi:methylated-DNA-[protein]-cysteine S-methyltransferase
VENKLKNKIKHNEDLTAFQKQVLITTLDIPVGQTRSYKWVAQQIGSPGAARAVGNTLSVNPYAPKVPCHRIIASDGTIGGYSGGIAKKKKLLKNEINNIRSPLPPSLKLRRTLKNMRG